MQIRVWLSTTPWVNDTLPATPCDTQKTVRYWVIQTFYCSDHPRMYRYVVIQRITQEKPEALCLCGVQVFGGDYDFSNDILNSFKMGSTI